MRHFAIGLLVGVGLLSIAAAADKLPAGAGGGFGLFVELDPSSGGQTITQPTSTTTAALTIDDFNGNERVNFGESNQITTRWNIHPASDGQSTGLGSFNLRYQFGGFEHIRYGQAEELSFSLSTPDYTTAPDRRDVRVQCTSGTTCGWDLPAYTYGAVVSITVDSGSDDVVLKGTQSYFAGGATLTLSACDSVMMKNSAGTWIQLAPVVTLNTCPDEI